MRAFNLGDAVAVTLGDPKPGAVLDPVRTASGVVVRAGSMTLGVRVGTVVWNVAPSNVRKEISR